MRTASRTIVLVAVLLLAFAGAAAGRKADGKTTLTGEYIWAQGGTSGDLKAVFTPSGKDGQWDVAFHFEHRGKPHTYHGTATGSLTGGELKGTVFNEGKKREFTFSGSFTDGKFSGTHAESGRRLGTLTLGG